MHTPDATPRRLKVGRHVVLVADPSMQKLYRRLEGRVSRARLPVLIRGESGTGKEIIARFLHEASPRQAGPFIALNCAALPENLVESELFGFCEGAFSGALTEKKGLFEAAHGGTLFLDEVAEMSPGVQAKLLRVLEDHRVRRLGETEERDIDVRIVAATYRDLERAVRKRRFRRDLYFRFKGIVVHLPPLRERPEELETLAREFVERHAEMAGLDALRWTPSGLRALHDYRWPGNIRELNAACGHLVATVDGDEVRADHLLEWTDGVPEPEGTTDLSVLGSALPAPAAPKPSGGKFAPIADELAALERTRIQEALEASGGNRTLAAQLISMPQRTFSNKLRQYALTRPQ